MVVINYGLIKSHQIFILDDSKTNSKQRIRTLAIRFRQYFVFPLGDMWDTFNKKTRIMRIFLVHVWYAKVNIPCVSFIKYLS